MTQKVSRQITSYPTPASSSRALVAQPLLSTREPELSPHARSRLGRHGVGVPWPRHCLRQDVPARRAQRHRPGRQRYLEVDEPGGLEEKGSPCLLVQVPPVLWVLYTDRIWFTIGCSPEQNSFLSRGARGGRAAGRASEPHRHASQHTATEATAASQTTHDTRRKRRKNLSYTTQISYTTQTHSTYLDAHRQAHRVTPHVSSKRLHIAYAQ